MDVRWNGRRWVDPEAEPTPGLLDLIRWGLTRTPGRWPERVATAAPPIVPPGPDEVAVTFVGHATFLVRGRVRSLLTDPIWSERASPVRWAGPRRVRPPAHPMEALTALGRSPRGAALLVDQCEELFSLCDDPHEQQEFLRALTAEAMSGRFHGNDERIDVESLALTTQAWLDTCELFLG